MEQKKENLFLVMMGLPDATQDLFEVLDKCAHPKRYISNYRKKVGKRNVNKPLPWPSPAEIVKKYPPLPEEENPLLTEEEILFHFRLLEEKGIINTQTEEIYLNTDLCYEEEQVYEALCLQAHGKDHAILNSWTEIESKLEMPSKTFRLALGGLKEKKVIRVCQEESRNEQTGQIKVRHVCWFLTHPALEDMQAYFAQSYFQFWTRKRKDEVFDPPVSCQIKPTDNLSAICHPV